MAKPQVSWGELRPARKSEWREDETLISLLVPRFGRGKLGQWLERRLAPKPYEVHLDEIGTFVWRKCDGVTKVVQIAEAMRLHFGERIEPTEDRLIAFLQKLLRGRFVAVDQ